MDRLRNAFAALLLLSSACATTSANRCDPEGISRRNQTPDRCQVLAAMRAITPGIAACSRAHGSAGVIFTFAPDGRVSEAQTVPGKYPNGTTATDPAVLNCIVAVARLARVPPFPKESFRIKFPFIVGPGARQRP